MGDSSVRVVLLVPRRDDGGHRDRLWALCRRRWETLHPEWPIFEGYHTEGPFNRSAAIDTASEMAGDWDVAVIIDADVFLPPENVIAAVENAARTGKVTWAMRRWHGLSERATTRLLASPERLLDPSLTPTDVTTKEPHNSSCIAIRRDAWETVGGFDDRFRGWGWEDGAFFSVAYGLVGGDRIEGDVFALWHGRAPGVGLPGINAEYVTNARLGLRYMLALRRDHGLHDRDKPADAAEMARDIENLRKSDRNYARHAARFRLPDWDDWWPTLEELRDRRPASRSAALIVHSGGELGSWEVRSQYLRRALASIDEHISHRWERRVIFSDWGDCPELVSIAEERGFTIEGPAGRLGYTGSMRAMWKYLRDVRPSYLFLTEDDFLIDRDVDIEAMATVLDEHPHLVQMALLRGPFYPPEKEPETILGHPLHQFEEKRNGAGSWLEHRRFFTANPMLMPRRVASWPWPNAPHSEAVFGRSLFKHQPKARAAFWGSGETWITHIGDVRGSSGDQTY